MSNPYQPSKLAASDHGVYANHARRVKGGFLYRVIEVESPFSARIRYSGWWFVQSVSINGRRVWWTISWKTLLREIAFTVPASIFPGGRDVVGGAPGRIEIDFGRSLSIRRFRLWLGQELVYDEVA